MQKIELLAPAGDLEKLRTAIIYGADAVYVSGKSFGMRTASKNLDLDEFHEAVKFAHEHNAKIYVTLNIMPHNSDFEGLEEYLVSLKKIKIDALIISDPGVFYMVKKIWPESEIHLSTQASTVNSLSVKFWKEQGVARVVLARELNLNEIQKICQDNKDVELEIFCHGALCISHSGRCLLSNYMTHRDANRGNCAQACRWKYRLVEEKRPDEYYPIEENDRGTFIFNSKDLCTIDIVDQLIRTGVHSLKIEGRVKSQYYVATIVHAYRQAIDAVYEDRYTKDLIHILSEEVRKASYRDYTQGFLKGFQNEDDQLYTSSSYIRQYDFLAICLGYDEDKEMYVFEQRNRFFPGEEIEFFGPHKKSTLFKMPYEIFDKDGLKIDIANIAQQKVYFKSDIKFEPYDILRKAVSEQS